MEVEFRAEVVEDHLEIEYSVTNRTASPILLLDRQQGDGKVTDENPFGNVDRNWAYVLIVPDGLWSYKAVIRRCMREYGSPTDHPIMPFGRTLAALDKVSDTIKLPLPIEEFSFQKGGNPYEDPNVPLEKVTIRRAEFSVGWSAEFPPEPREPHFEQFQLGTEALWYMAGDVYGWLYPLQEISTSKTISVNWEGLR